MVEKGLCEGMIERIKTKPLPFITSYYAAAVAADMAGYGRVYCIICDADINRVWVATDPRKSRIEYLVPCGSVLRRLKQYGVPDERIFMTGFPLPKELLGGPDLGLLKARPRPAAAVPRSSAALLAPPRAERRPLPRRGCLHRPEGPQAHPGLRRGRGRALRRKSGPRPWPA